MRGLIGEKLKHSFSPEIHNFFGDGDYKLFELKREELGEFIKRKDVTGFNVTVPYKKDIMSYLDVVDETAKRIGAVNTVVKKDGKSYGFNTDYYGLKYLFAHNGVSLSGKKALILGSGGASAAAETLLKDENVDYKIVSRTGKVNYENVYELKDTEIIINATPVGMYPQGEGLLIDLAK
ncbi:MAG: shikimate kinase, partial [Clostridia bacterium]|nr:shikimate kinase [Clostridia bacterium]